MGGAAPVANTANVDGEPALNSDGEPSSNWGKLSFFFFTIFSLYSNSYLTSSSRLRKVKFYTLKLSSIS